MKNSNQLSKTYRCLRNRYQNISVRTDSMSRALAQKQVIKRILDQEPIPDIKEELRSILATNNYVWENNTQMIMNLALYEARINRFTNWVSINDETILPISEDIDKTVTLDGDQVNVFFDYISLNQNSNTAYINKIKTGRYKPLDQDNFEPYALGELGKKLYPNSNIKVRYCFLAEKDKDSERLCFHRNYAGSEDMRSSVVYTIKYDDTEAEILQQKYHEANEEKNRVICEASECDNCPMKNVCHFETAPIALETTTSVRPMSEIRLTRAQNTIINYEQGIARVNARPGSGKTLVVAMRIAKLLEKGADPSKICLMTFTKLGCEEMTARTINYAAEKGILVDPNTLTSTTFNAFCMDLIKNNCELLGYSENIRVVSEETKSGIVNRIIDQFPHIKNWVYGSFETNTQKYKKYGSTAFVQAKRIFGEIKRNNYTFEEAMEFLVGRGFSEEDAEIIFQMHEEYNFQLKQRNVIEFDDQIRLAFELSELNPELFEELGFQHIIIDEFQDTDLPQIELLKKIIDTSSFKSFMAVGDDAQSIFKFRNTSPEYMINFETYFGAFDDFSLLENHRSNKATIDFANIVNQQSSEYTDKELIATKPQGISPVMKGFYSTKQEYTWVAQQIKQKIENGMTASDIAFIGSTKQELVSLASELTNIGVPSILMSPIPYTSNSRVNALCTFFKSYMSKSTQGFLDYQNVLLNGQLKNADKETIKNIIDSFSRETSESYRNVFLFKKYALALDVDKIDEGYQSFLEKIEYLSTLEELNEFFLDFERYGKDSCFKREGLYDGVCLTTIHSSKGLEWDTTFLSLSALDRMAYHKNEYKFRSSGDKDENYRKWFVGATRARNELIMTSTHVLQQERKCLILNNYTSEAFSLLNEANDFNPIEYYSQLAKETQELGANDKKFEFLSQNNRKNKKSKKTVPFILKASQNLNDFMKKRSCDEMTEKEKLEYESLVKNSRQTSLFDRKEKEFDKPEKIEEPEFF